MYGLQEIRQMNARASSRERSSKVAELEARESRDDLIRELEREVTSLRAQARAAETLRFCEEPAT